MPRIAIPTPTSFDPVYNRVNWAAFADAVRDHGAEPVRIALDLSPRAIADLANECAAVLLPGSSADVNPAKYGEKRGRATAAADAVRENVDELLLQDAHNLYKPILGVCFGAQILNVWRSGTLEQDLSRTVLDHAAPGKHKAAHKVAASKGTLLASIVECGQPCRYEDAGRKDHLIFPVNSSHHQAIGTPGDGLRVSGVSLEDGVVEAIEGPQHLDCPHFVLGVQWHPERMMAACSASSGLFERLTREAAEWSPRVVTTSVASRNA